LTETAWHFLRRTMSNNGMQRTRKSAAILSSKLSARR
jgi:hypothetical protein